MARAASRIFSTAAMARAASRIFSQHFFRLMMLIPSFFFLKMYCSMVVSELLDPMWVVAANILVMSSSVIARAECPPDILKHDFFQSYGKRCYQCHMEHRRERGKH